MLSIRIGNVTLPNPIVIASGPLTDKFSKIKAASDAGAGAVSLKLTFVKVPFQSQMRSYSLPGNVIISPTNKRLDLATGAELMRQVKKELPVRMMANFSAVGSAVDEWRQLAEEFLDAGTDMLEPNFCCPNLDTSDPKSAKHSDHGGASIAENPEVCSRLIGMMRGLTDKPIVPKVIIADRAMLLRAAKACVEAGADGMHVVGLPISGLPPIDDEGVPDIPLLKGTPQGSANGSICKYSTFLATAQLGQVMKKPVMASGGLDNWKDCTDAILWGATSTSICSTVMWSGWEVVGQMLAGMKNYMEAHNYTSLEDFRGKALAHFTTPDKVKLIQGHSKVEERYCIGCGKCVRPGHCEAIEIVEGKAKVDAEKCIACGVCRALCPTGAISYQQDEEK